MNDPKLDPIWAECGKLGIPVAIHVGDPEAFYDPIDGKNERYDQLVKRPEYRFSGGDFPKHSEVVKDLENVFLKHHGTTFISLHVGNWPENLDYVSEMLRLCPNVVVEFGARQAELGRQPNRTRKFFTEFSDRVLFGCDGNTEDIYPHYFRWLETDDDHFDYYSYPNQGRWRISGLKLPDDILEKIYHLNAERMFQQAKVAAAKPSP
ncbi:MAG TPA: amidohydrolase family protein [Verrucomicrobiae bacterium]